MRGSLFCIKKTKCIFTNMTTWIAIKNKKPAIGQAVLLYDANSTDQDESEFIKYLASELINENGVLEWSTGFDEPQNFYNYTHWMPLPNPPSL
jgi:hypothetical protein